ncbi:MAG TPA: putative porin [Burkholderiales bacterium]|jgi:hypothetical protein
MKSRGIYFRASKLAAALACAGLALGVCAAHATEREDLEQLRSTTLGLIQALVDQGLLSREKAAELIKKAESRNTTTAAGEPARVGADGKPVVRVPYIPESVKEQIRDQVKQEVLAQAKQERWGDPGTLPDWLDRLHFEGDLRMRLEQDLFDKNNAPGSFFQQQNVNSATGPTYGVDLTNTTDDRTRLSLRARFGFTTQIGDTVSGGFRLATGSLTSPASTSQTLGASNNNFNRYTVGLDRGYLRWEPYKWLSLTGGRMPNPFFSTDLIWAEDLAFDGIAATVKTNFSDKALGYVTGGAFPLAENGSNKLDKWLYGLQGGAEWEMSPTTRFKVGVAQYIFQNYEGTPSAFGSSQLPNYANSQYGTNVRQKGNSLFNIIDPALQTGTSTAPPVWALMSRFKPLNLTATVDLSQFDPVHVIFTADYVKNVGFDRNEIRNRTGIDLEPKTAGYQYRLAVGMPQMDHKGDWQAFGIVRQLERDAVVDGFTDTTWHLGGTNYRGYSIGGSYGVDRNSWLTLRWTSTKSLSDTSLSGLPLDIDVLQLDFNARF